MPIIQVVYAVPEPSPARRAPDERALAEAAAELARSVLGKSPDVTAVVVRRVPAEHWFCGGRSLADDRRASFFLDIKITEGSNTKQETGRFVAETFRVMGELLGPLHPESYVHVHEVRAYAYGYGGLTQERRFIDAQRAPA